jgi:hypothetical protein
MKSQPDPDTTPEEKFTAFESDLRHALTFTKGDVQNLEEAYQQGRTGKPKRGPKPRPPVTSSSASGRASSGKD